VNTIAGTKLSKVFFDCLPEEKKRIIETRKAWKRRCSDFVVELATGREWVWGSKTNCVKNNDFENKDVMDLTF